MQRLSLSLRSHWTTIFRAMVFAAAVPAALLFIALFLAPQPVSATPATLTCGPNADRVWLYDSPTTLNVVSHLKCGDSVEVIGRAPGYAKVRDSAGKEGFVPLAVLPDLPPAPEGSPEAAPHPLSLAEAAALARHHGVAGAASPAAATSAPVAVAQVPAAPAAVAQISRAPVAVAPAPVPAPAPAVVAPAPTIVAKAEPSPAPRPVAVATPAPQPTPQPVAEIDLTTAPDPAPAPAPAPAPKPAPVHVARTSAPANAPAPKPVRAAAPRPAPVAPAAAPPPQAEAEITLTTAPDPAPAPRPAVAENVPPVPKPDETISETALASPAKPEYVSDPAAPIVHTKVKPSDDEDEDAAADEAAVRADHPDCSAYFSAYGVSPNQYKWIVTNRKKFPGICPAPSPSLVDFVVIFTHDVNFYNFTMPTAIHTDSNGLSNWTPMSMEDSALVPVREMDKNHREYVWVFHTRRGAFDPARFSSKRHPLFEKAESNTFGSHAGDRTAEAALHFIADNRQPN